VADDDQRRARHHGRRLWRQIMAGVGICVAFLVIFHRPILLAIGRRIVLQYAAKENLRANFRVEGNPFSHVTIRNLHAAAIGPSSYESIDIDYLYLDYSLLGYARHGLPRLFNDVEARSANIVLNPSKAPLRPRPPHPQLKLPRFFPEGLRATDTTLIVRNQPYDFVVGHADLELNPRTPGELRIETLQLPSGDTWSRISGQTSYTNKNLIVRDLNLSDQEQLHFLQVDASQIDANYLAANINCTVGRGQISASAALTETKSSLDTQLHLAAQKVAAEALNKFLVIPENYLTGEIERLNLDGAGVIEAPRTWSGTMSLQMSDVHRPAFAEATAGRRPDRERARPNTARLHDSVPPLVKMISCGFTCSSAASLSRASSTAARASRPAACTLDGLPKCRPRYGSMASRAASHSGVVAL